MDFKIKQVSSLEKVFKTDVNSLKELKSKILMKGETFSYQIAMQCVNNTEVVIDIDSPLKKYIKVYAVKNAPIDYPTYTDADEDYLTKEQGLMPDILEPVEYGKTKIRPAGEGSAVWITVKLPEDIPQGKYEVNTTITYSGIPSKIPVSPFSCIVPMNIEVINEVLPKQSIYFTQWFYADCIAVAHNVEIFSDEHWDLIDKYMALASELGINLILTPVITPPLDTDEGITRPCVQLVKIEKNGEKYNFDFTLLKKWIDMAHKNGIESFEISHLFSQWGLKCTPNIKVWENGVCDYKFGWHMDSKDPEYKNFLEQFLPALLDYLTKEGIKDNCWFHVSDEPRPEHIENYNYAYNLIKPLLGDCKTMDAISSYEFYKKGLIPHPVTASNHIDTFIENKAQHQWAYYCCSQYIDVGNRFLAMPSYRNRILGLQLYKFNIEGFLQWGYNFYFAQRSRYEINPYITTSADKAFPSGDPFSVYPVKGGVVPSLRAIIFKEALEDIEICKKLESYIGREKVVEMIDKEAGMDLTFSNYPRNNDYIPELIEKMEQLIKEHCKG